MDSLVTAQWLAENLAADDVIVLDASRHLPAAGRDPAAEFEAAHIPGARFLDLATLTNAASDVPAAFPTAQQVSERLAQLGVRTDDRIVLYDDSAVKTAARAWFTLKAHGIENAAILDGGLAAWRDQGLTVESGDADIEPRDAGPLLETMRVASKSDMLSNIGSGAYQVIDARGADRVFGSGIDPVHGGQNGRIPGALNLPFGQVFDTGGRYKSPEALRTAFLDAGVDLDRPVITSCGSGVTASVLLFALHRIGKDDVHLYDGSWQEWEADPATPKAQGPQ